MERWKFQKRVNNRQKMKCQLFFGFVRVYFCCAPLKSQMIFLKALGGMYLVPKKTSPKHPLSSRDKAGDMIFW